MSILPEAVTIKFTELFNAIQYATDDLKMAGAEANLDGDFPQVTAINNSCRRLQELEAEIKSVLKNFESTHKTRLTVKSSSPKNTVNRTRKPSDHIRVKVADKVIEKQKVAETFVEVLKIFGLDKVANLNKIVTGVPLLAKTPINGYQSQKRIEHCYITTHVNMQSASKILEDISKELNIPIQIEVVEH